MIPPRPSGSASSRTKFGDLLFDLGQRDFDRHRERSAGVEATMINANKCRALAKACRLQASYADEPRKARLLQNIARSLSGLATQLDALAREGQSLPKLRGKGVLRYSAPRTQLRSIDRSA
jgi:hypothetical protein